MYLSIGPWMILIDSFPNLNLCVQDQIGFLIQRRPPPSTVTFPSPPLFSLPNNNSFNAANVHPPPTNVAHRRIIHLYPSGGGAVSSPNHLCPLRIPRPPSTGAERSAVMTISSTMTRPPSWIIRCGHFQRQAFRCFPNFRWPLVSSPGQRFLWPGCVRVSSEPSHQAPFSNTPPSIEQPTSLAPLLTGQTSRRHHHQLSRPPPTPLRRHRTTPLRQHIDYVLDNVMKTFRGMFGIKPDKNDTPLEIVFEMVFVLIMGALSVPTPYIC